MATQNQLAGLITGAVPLAAVPSFGGQRGGLDERMASMLAKLNEAWLTESLGVVLGAYEDLARSACGEYEETEHDQLLREVDADYDSKAATYASAWKLLEGEKRRLRVLLNDLQIDLIDADWLTREILWHAAEVIYGGPEEKPAIDSDAAKQATGHWALGAAPIRGAIEHLRSHETQGDDEELTLQTAICTAVKELWQEGVEWPGQKQIAGKSGYSLDAVKKETGHLQDLGRLETGRNGRGYKVCT